MTGRKAMHLPLHRRAVLRQAALPLAATVLALCASVPAGLAGATLALADQATPAIVDSTRPDGNYGEPDV